MSADRDKVAKLLKNYRYYKVAVKGYNRQTTDQLLHNRYMSAAPCRTAVYSDMPMGGSSGGPRIPTLTGGWGFEDELEYSEYTYIIGRIDDALDSLTDEARSVITLKWMDGLTLDQISKRKGYSEAWAKKVHRKAIGDLALCFRFDMVPKVDSVPVA